jgi:hypothetical protein
MNYNELLAELERAGYGPYTRPAVTKSAAGSRRVKALASVGLTEAEYDAARVEMQRRNPQKLRMLDELADGVAHILRPLVQRIAELEKQVRELKEASE